MRRAPLVAAGTVAGIAAVLAFPTHTPHLVVPANGEASGPAPAGTPTPPPTPPTAPATSPPAAPTSSAPPSPSPTDATATSVPAARSATGADETYPYGDLSVTVTVDGKRITKVKLANLQDSDGRSAQIDNYAVPQLEQQVIAADSVNIDGVSGATFTSQAFVDSVASALSKLGFKA